MARGGKPRVYIEGDASGVTRAARQAEASLKRLDRAGSKSLGGLSKTAKGLNPHLAGAIAGFTSLAGAAALLKDSVKTTEDLAKGTAMISRTTGESTQEASRWVAVAKVRGLEVTRLNRSFVGLAKAIEGANAGSKKQAELFKDLGISQKELAKGDVSQILGDIADAFAKMPDGAKKAADAQQLFGRGAASILPMLNKGNAALREQLGLSDKYGTTLTKGQLAASLKAAQAQRELNLAMMGLKVQLGQAVIPALTVGITKFTAFVAQMRSGEGAGGKFAAKLKDIWKGAKPVVEQLGKIVTAVGKFAAAHPGLTKVAGALLAAGVAVKTITFASQITGIGKLIRLAGTLGSVGASGGASMAARMLSAFRTRFGTGGSITRQVGGVLLNAGSDGGAAAGGAAASKLGSKFKTRLPAAVKGIAASATWAAIGSAIGAVMAAAIMDQIGQKLQDALSGGANAGGNPRAPHGNPTQDAWSVVRDALGFRSGGMVFQGGGTVPALVSSGEVIVEPGGSAWRAPGPPVAADNVPAMLKPGSAVLTWDGQARVMAGQSVGQAVAMQAPHFAGGGWVRTGATIDNTRGQAPTYSDHGGMSFAELLEAGTNAGMRPDATQLLGLPRKRYGMAMETSILARMPGSSKSYRIWKNDVGSGQLGNGHFTIDLHGKIASKLGWHPNQDIEIKRDDGTGDSLTAGGDPPRTITTTRYAPPSPGTGRSSRSAFDSGFESGVSDPFGLVRGQDRSDYYNSTKRGLFGTWTTSKRTLPGTPARHPGQGSAASGRAGKLVEWLGTQVGYHEGPGNSNKYGPSAAWCGYFVQYGLGKVAGLPISSDMGYVPHIRDMIGSHAAPFKGPVSAAAMQPGDVITWPGHTGFYIGGGQAISGNYGDGVRKHGSTAPGPIVKAGRPAYRRGGRIPRFRGGGVVSRVRGGHSQLLPTASKVAGGFSGDTTPTRNAAYSTLWKLIGLGIGRGDEPSVKSTYARELSLIDRLGYDDLRGLSQDVKSIYRRQFGSTPRARTIRARLTGVLGRIDAAIGRSIGRPLGVADSVEEDISARGGLLPDQLTLGGIDPDSKEGIDATIDFNNRSITRLWQRRAALKDALARAKRAKRPDVAKRISDEIKDVDSQVTTFAAANVRLRRARISAPTNAEAQAGTTSGGGTDPDLQAQLDQANVRATVAQRTAGLSEAFIRTAFGSGDIGRGGSYAWTAAGGSGAAFQPGMSITINTLHPGDSQTLAAIADAATAGMGQQGFVTSPRAVSGV